MLRRVIGGVAIALFICSSAQLAVAQDFNYQNFLIGQRALGVGGAVTGSPHDASAVYYNPAGLAQLRGSTISGSLATDTFSNFEIDNGYTTSQGSADLTSTEAPDVPMFFGAAVKFGSPQADGIRPHALGVSAFVPAFYVHEYDASIVGENDVGGSSLHIRHQDYSDWYGLSYAYRANADLGFGVSGFLVLREQQHVEQETDVALGERLPSGAFEGSQTFIRQSSTELDAALLVFRLGALWRLSPRWQLGLMFQPPGIQMAASGRLAEQDYFSDAETGDEVSFFSSDQDDLDANAPIPWALRVGVELTLMENLTALLDVTLHGRLGSKDDPIVPIGPAEEDPIFGRAPENGLFSIDEYWSRYVGNVNLGFEGIIAGKVPIRAGLFTNLSSAPPVEGPTDVRLPERINTFGATLGVGVITKYFSVDLGVMASLGRGQSYGLVLTEESVASGDIYSPADVRSHLFFIYLGGSVTGQSGEEQDARDADDSETNSPDMDDTPQPEEM